jgi:hypothetical protein
MGAAALPLLGWRPDTNNAADGQDGIEHSFAYGGVGVVRLLPVDRERPGQTRFKHRKISVILLAPPRHGRGIDNFPLVDKQPNVDVAVRSVITRARDCQIDRVPEHLAQARSSRQELRLRRAIRCSPTISEDPT